MTDKHEAGHEEVESKQKTFTVPADPEGIIILKVIDGGKASNIGTTGLRWKNNRGDEPRLIAPGNSVILNAPNGVILVTTQDEKNAGQISVETRA